MLSHLSHCPVLLGTGQRDSRDSCVPVLLAALDYPADGGLAAIDLRGYLPDLLPGLGQLQDKAIPLSRFVVTRFLQVFLFG